MTIQRLYCDDLIPATLTAEERKLIKGMQGNIWGEFIPTESRMQTMAFPRAIALAEKAWTPVDRHDYDDFLLRLTEQVKRLDYLRYKVRRADKVHIVCAHILHTQKRLRKLADRKLKALSLRGYLKVLAEAAPQAAPREKHRPRAFVAADTRLLPHMLFRACDAHHITLAAKALAARSVNAAPARAQRAALHNIRRHFFTSQIRQGRISLPVFYTNFKLNAYLSDTFVPDR
jgi:hypothetical protein